MRRASRAPRLAGLLAGSLLLASGLLSTGAAAVLAQAQAQTGIGVEVPFVSDEGVTLGTVDVRQIDDPFTGFDPASPAATDSRYVGLLVAFTAADDQQMDVNPIGLQLLDTTGHIWTPSYVPRPADVKIPDLQSQTMAPGNRLSGFVGFIVPSDVTVDQVLYSPDYYRAIVLADLVGGTGPTPGSAAVYTAEDGGQVTITANVTDPFTDNDPGSPPEDGQRYVSVAATFENSGSQPYKADPYALILHLQDGHLVYSQYVPRPYEATVSDLESQTLNAGDHISGLVNFTVPATAVIQSVDYQPESAERIIVADLTDGATPAGSPAPAPTAAPAATAAPVEPVASPSPGASAGTAQ
jgi:hypothetical protein